MPIQRLLATCGLAFVLAASTSARAEEPPRTTAPPPAERSKEKQGPVDAVVINPAKSFCVSTKDLKPLSPRPKLALVLSGGGARGAAHIGVLKVLEELHVKPDLIVGTSMGSIIGGLYAEGYSSGQIEGILKGVDWKQIFIDKVDRTDRSYRRKQDDATFLIPLRLRFKGWKPFLPASLLGGQRMALLLRSLEIQATGEQDFDKLTIPFRAVGANLADGQGVVIEGGSVATAQRASMAIAGLFPPVDIEGIKLIDGGAASNLPIGIAQALGAERIIAVDITSPLGDIESLGSLVQIYNQWTGYITEGNRREDIRRLRPGDVIISPELGDISFIGFDRAPEAMEIGEKYARAAIPVLKPFAADDATWKAFQERHHLRPREETMVEALNIENHSWVDDDIVRAHVQIPTGYFDEPKVNEQVMRLHGLDYSGTIDVRLQPEHGAPVGGEPGPVRNTLSLNVPEKVYGHNSLQFGASFRDDFQGDTGYALSFRHLRIAANRRGGEWENIGQIGDVDLARTEFYQPFDAPMKWFTSAGAEARRTNWDIWEDEQVLAEFRVNRNSAHIDFGRVFGRWGEARVGAFYAYETGDVRVGDPTIPSYHETDAGYSFAFNVDTLDAVVFPHRGTSVQARWYDSREAWGADLDRTRATLRASKAIALRKVTLYPVGDGCINLDEPATIGSSCKLGGFLQLSGLGQTELLGDKSVFASLIGYYALARLDLGSLTQGVYLGLSLEAGQVYQRDDAIDWNSLLKGGSLFFGARTVLGPVYLGYGYTEGDRSRIYFLLGQRF
ncbi:MAG TPA: patatin-like phospholipase family protein [Candidatus Polarisedimenticolia bacterium]|nr:patatin-like phospholipase family protein [Candidatus Polarisedimenticolia bacterium]